MKILLSSVCVLAVAAVTIFFWWQSQQPTSMAEVKDTEVHVHSDFLIIVNGEEIKLTDDKYQSDRIDSLRHPKFHLHDNDDEVMHRHDEGLTLGTFFTSLGFGLADDCIRLDTSEVLCTDEDSVLRVYVNGTVIENPSSYVNQEEDKILVYYGEPNNPKLSEYLSSITDNSCFYSGTCPERGIAPPESCGLTCEL